MIASSLSLASFVAIVFAALAGCSTNESDLGPGEVRIDVGPFPDVGHDAASSDSLALDALDAASPDGADGGGKLDAFADGTIDAVDADAGRPPICPTTFPSATTTAVTYPRAVRGELLAAITWDERTMAWTTGAGAVTSVHYADRASADAAFTDEHVLPTTLGPFPDDKVALSADGLTMIFLSADRHAIHQVKRTSRAAEFDPSTVTSAPFGKLTGKDGEGGVTAAVGDLVLSKDGKWLLYTDLGRTTGASIMLSVLLSDGTWDAPTPITALQLAIASGQHRRPTGLSSDARSLFFFDEVTGTVNVALHAAGTASFTEFHPLAVSGMRPMPSDACNRLYLSIEDDSADDAGPPDSATAPTFTIVHAP
jgi:hypothetical protein